MPTVGGLRVNYVRAFAKDYGNNFRQMEIHLNIENTNSSAAYFNQENFVPMLGNSRYGGEFTFTGLNKWNGSRYVQDVQLKAGETQTISYSCKLQPEDLSAGLRTVDPAPWSLTLLYGGSARPLPATCFRIITAPNTPPAGGKHRPAFGGRHRTFRFLEQ